MENFKKFLLKLLYPGKIISVLLVLSAAILLILIFVKKMEESIAAYFVYVLSFYALCVAASSFPKLIKKTKDFLHANTHTSRYLSEAELRLKIALYNGTLISLAYAIFKLVAGVIYHSFWFGAVAVYYIVLCLIRSLLIKNERKSSHFEADEKRLHHEWVSYRNCGWLLFLLNVAMSSMVFQMVWQNKGYSYPGFVIYASAAFTFYRLTMTIIRIVKNRKDIRPVFAAAKALDLSISLMALFALQTAMFASFGADMVERTRMIMNAATGGTVCLLVVAIAVYMIINSTKKMKEKI